MGKQGMAAEEEEGCRERMRAGLTLSAGFSQRKRHSEGWPPSAARPPQFRREPGTNGCHCQGLFQVSHLTLTRSAKASFTSLRRIATSLSPPAALVCPAEGVVFRKGFHHSPLPLEFLRSLKSLNAAPEAAATASRPHRLAPPGPLPRPPLPPPPLPPPPLLLPDPRLPPSPLSATGTLSTPFSVLPSAAAVRV